MARVESARHPLCTCPVVTWDGPPPDRAACDGGSTAHPVLSPEDLDRLLKEFHRGR